MIDHESSRAEAHPARVPRRQVLGFLGAGAVAATLAACGGASATPTAGTSAGTTATGAVPTSAGGAVTTAGQTAAAQPSPAAAGQKKGGQFNGGWPYEQPPTGHYNHFVTKGITLGIYEQLVSLPPCYYLWADNKYAPVLAERWGFEGGENFTMTLKANLKWDDSAPLTSKDVVATFIGMRLYNSQLFQYVDRVEARDERTIAFHMNNPSTVVERYILRAPIRAHALYGRFTDQAATLYGQGRDDKSEEIKKVRADLDQYRPDRWPSSGPYALDPRSMTEASCELVRNPGGLNGDVARFDRLKLYNGEVPIITPLVLNKDVDYVTHGMAVATDKQMQAQGIRVLRTSAHFGGALHVNYANPKMKVFADKRVRQAIAHAVKREDNAATALGESGKAVRYMNGVPDPIIEKWLSKEDLAKHNQYPYDQNKAADLLAAAGCRKQGAQWLDPDGKAMEYECLVPAEFFDWSNSGQDVADQLGKFGIKILIRAISFTQIPVERREGRFELAYDAWGTGNPHPHFSFVASLLNKVPPLANGPYTSFDLKQKTSVVGDVDFQQLITESALGLDVEKQRASILKAALAFNELLPVIPFFERYMNGPALEGVRVTGWLKDGDPLYQNSAYNDNYTTILLYNGTLGPK